MPERMHDASKIFKDVLKEFEAGSAPSPSIPEDHLKGITGDEVEALFDAVVPPPDDFHDDFHHADGHADDAIKPEQPAAPKAPSADENAAHAVSSERRRACIAFSEVLGALGIRIPLEAFNPQECDPSRFSELSASLIQASTAEPLKNGDQVLAIPMDSSEVSPETFLEHFIIRDIIESEDVVVVEGGTKTQGDILKAAKTQEKNGQGAEGHSKPHTERIALQRARILKWLAREVFKAGIFLPGVRSVQRS